MSKSHRKSQICGATPRRKNTTLRPLLSATVSTSLTGDQHYTTLCEKRLRLAHRMLETCRSDPRSTRRDDLDQCPATIQTTLRRLALLMTMSGLERRRVLLLGDDDLLSVALVAAGVSACITVVDLDHSLLSLIAGWTKPAVVQLVHHDLRFGLPDTMAGSY